MLKTSNVTKERRKRSLLLHDTETLLKRRLVAMAHVVMSVGWLQHTSDIYLSTIGVNKHQCAEITFRPHNIF